jgi:hypothetical protein
MRRREFIIALNSAAAWSLAAYAQSEIPVTGYLNGGFEDTALPVLTAFSKDRAIPAILGGDR